MSQQRTTREQWLTQAATILEHNILLPAIKAANYPRPQMNYRVAVAPLTRSKAIGTCYAKSQSTDDTNEIFITATLDDSTRILDVLLHELIHASDDCQSGHKGYFVHVAKQTGLTGKMTATTASDDLRDKLLDIVDAIGDIPHHKMKDDARAKPKQSARMIKIECTSCGFNFRASKTQIARITSSQCNCCGYNHGLYDSIMAAH